MSEDKWGEFSADDIDDAVVLEGLRKLEDYKARVAAFQQWVADHGVPRKLGPDELDPDSDEVRELRRQRRRQIMGDIDDE